MKEGKTRAKLNRLCPYYWPESRSMVGMLPSHRAWHMGGLRNECLDTYFCGMPHVYKPFPFMSVVLEGWQGGPVRMIVNHLQREG